MTENRLFKSFKFFLSLFIFYSFIIACSDDDNNNYERETKTIYETIDKTMSEWYLWNEELPNINSSSYSDVNKYFEDLLVNQDRWSYITNLDALIAYLENGTYKGYGLAFKYDSEGKLRVKLIFDESPLASKGITRGWKLININGLNIADLTEDDVLNELDKNTSTFIFENNLGEQKEITASQQEIDQNSVLKREVINYEGTNVAYLAFDSFLGSSEDALNEAFDYFKANAAKELVLDLRYNGGGSTTISNQLSSLITGNLYEGKIYSKVFHNDSKSGENFTYAFSNQASAHGFERVFIITTDRTASASEMVINGLKPYLGNDKVILIGSKTHGKPVGMYVFEEPDFNLAIVPISFSITNANDEGDYFEGIPVDFEISDDLSRDFGDPEESNLQAALQYINQGNFPAITAAKSLSTTEREFKKKGFDLLIDAN
ncbi:S41 family peptidase [Marinifilum fragile]|uniref:S41 family peptidase n=1 Tax=Marinifilum fragile TaxID=570161 RepID=UPI002AAAD9CF|nr:S41 family peptidase [Marinifilum fragile]